MNRSSIARAHYDTVVVGARVAGAATALLLARAGLRVLVVERSRRGSDTLSTHALMRAGVMQLHRWGVLPRLLAAGTPPIRRTTFHYGSEPVVVDIKDRDGVDALFAPRRTLLDVVLAEAAVESGAQVMYGTTARERSANSQSIFNEIQNMPISVSALSASMGMVMISPAGASPWLLIM